MSDENDPKPEGEPAGSGNDESAAAAKEAARDFANNAGAMFKGLDQKLQIYLVALAVTLLCSLIFGAYKAKTKMSKEMEALVTMTKAESSETSSALIGLDHKGQFGGKLAFLGAAAGIGILIWSTVAGRKDPWIPLGLAGAAGLAVLGILFTRVGLGGVEFMGAKISFSGTILGWWLPLAGAATATAVSVQRIMNA